jgi:NAD(P)-dependent dehydrogenase (short-subunit alcohol dehydrogenase family)
MSDQGQQRRQVAVVVGAGGGVGRATALTLTARGLRVIAIDRNETGLGELPHDVDVRVVDFVDPQTVAPALDEVMQSAGNIDVLVNTLGAFEVGDALSTTPAMFRLMMDVNLAPALWLSQAVAPHMQKGGAGSIVHVAARPGVEPTAGMAAYAVSKAALVHLTRILDLEFRPLGIRVNAVVPELIDTEKNQAFLPASALSHAVEPEAIAEIISFLVSDAAAPISGAVLPAYGA